MSAAAKVPDHALYHRDEAPRRLARAKLRHLEAKRKQERAGQLRIAFEEGKRDEVRQALLELGQDPHPDRPHEDSPVTRRAVELFPDGMTFAEVGFVLGMHKQSVKKLEERALRKLARHIRMSVDELDDLLREGEARGDYWDALDNDAW